MISYEEKNHHNFHECFISNVGLALDAQTSESGDEKLCVFSIIYDVTFDPIIFKV